METFLFLDTETTGFKKSGPLMQHRQARVCQIAMILTDAKGKTLSQFSSLIKPKDWTIHPKAQDVHGISDMDCIMFGIDQRKVVEMFIEYGRFNPTVVAHNEEFDRAMMEIELAYFGIDNPDIAPWYCTMKANTHITNGKLPKLDIVLQHYCNRSLGNDAHDALEDARACRDIYFAM